MSSQKHFQEYHENKDRFRGDLAEAQVDREPVLVSELFRFASSRDRHYVVAGFLLSVRIGAILPLNCVFAGYYANFYLLDSDSSPAICNMYIYIPHFEGNPLLCDEEFDWFLRFLVTNRVRTFLPYLYEITCAGPEKYVGVRLKDLMKANDKNKKANDTLTEGMKTLGFNEQGQ
ncbi:unnamed protein product [Heligmosomoides polygyrus]|uniref:Transmembrane protein 186 n=1 Tax=Heligmosomoides polygyrus TaxID=6339 RepID=A0A183G278_HELPZ|nr:unnamed protein product [Heligmosomoides polygyrus]